MKPYQTLITLTIILTTILVGINTPSLLQSLTWGKDSRMYFYSNAIKGGYTFAFVGNQSLFLTDFDSALQICSSISTATYITAEIFNRIPRKQVSFLSSNLSVVRATDGDLSCYLLHKQTKLKFSDCTNSTYNYGIDPKKIIDVTTSYLNDFQTTYYLH